MQTFPVSTSRRIKGFTLLELLLVILVISIFVTFASVNWNGLAKKGKSALLEGFSINIELIREDAISHSENRVLEFNISSGEMRVGRLDTKNMFVETGLLRLPEDYRIKDLVINGEPYSQGKCYTTIYASGMIDRTVVHLEGGSNSYSLLINPLTAKVTGENGYIQEISIGRRDNSS
jgi:prepilin-type N-terminal cleavage/methylation domain-containing protein